MDHSRVDRPEGDPERPAGDAEDPVVIEGGRVVTPTGTHERGRVVLSGGRIERVDPVGGAPVRSGTRVDASGRVVVPGVVDLHGDDVERELSPRPGARVDPAIALDSAARANVAAGVTTKFHAVAFEEAPEEGRSIDLAADLVRRIDRAEDLVGDNRVHARCELADDGVDAVTDLLAEGAVDLASVMNHVPGDGQFEDRAAFERRYSEGRTTDPEGAARVAAERQRVDPEERSERLRRVTEAARAHGVPVASHDDETPAEVQRAAAHGVDVCEFPVSMAAARRAADLGLTTAMGAPNLVRGGSLWDNLGAADAIEAGAVDVLCSDYHPPSLLAAAFVDTGEPLFERVARVTAAPAEAVGLDDRGRLEPGARADVLVVDPDPVPTVDDVFVAGRRVFRSPRD